MSYFIQRQYSLESNDINSTLKPFRPVQKWWLLIYYLRCSTGCESDVDVYIKLKHFRALQRTLLGKCQKQTVL